MVQLFNVIKKHQAIHGVSEDAVENGTHRRRRRPLLARSRSRSRAAASSYLLSFERACVLAATLSKDRFLELLEKSSSVAKSVDPKRFSELDQQQAKPSREKQTKVGRRRLYNALDRMR